MADIIKFDYHPRRLQEWLHQNFKRFNCLVAHRRFGKTYCVLNELVMRGLQNTSKNPHYAYIAPTYRQAKIIAWEYIKDFTSSIPGVKAYEQDLRIEIKRPDQKDKISFFLLGSENPDSIRGIYLDGCVLDEYGDCDPGIFTTVVRPALSDRLGWIIFIGTPKGKNHFHKLYKRFYVEQSDRPDQYFTALLKASVTNIIPKTELELAKLEMTEDEYNQEYECDFNAAILGAYYSKQMNRAMHEGRITKVPYDKYALVDTFFDLGVDDSTAIWFRQYVAGQWRYIDYYEMNDQDIPHYIDHLKSKPYTYGKHILPHDANQRSMQTNSSVRDTFEKLGLRVEVQKRQLVIDRINASRKRIDQSWFDEEKCAKGIEALRCYSREYDTKKGVFKNTPLHDWSSHGSDAFGYSALDDRPGDDYKRVKDLPRQVDNDYDIFDVF